jgi:hypothetical protein
MRSKRFMSRISAIFAGRYRRMAAVWRGSDLHTLRRDAIVPTFCSRYPERQTTFLSHACPAPSLRYWWLAASPQRRPGIEESGGLYLIALTDRLRFLPSWLSDKPPTSRYN